MASRSIVPQVKIAGLKRAAHFAGEAFAHEEPVALQAHPEWDRHLRRLWWLAAAVASLGLALIALR